MRIAVQQVAATLREVAAEDPDRVDRRAVNGQACRYVSNGEPSCLVAVVLFRLGVSVGVLRDLDREPGRRDGGVRIGRSRHPVVRRMEQAAVDLLAYVQHGQDNHQTWGETVADAFAERHMYGRFRRTWLG